VKKVLEEVGKGIINFANIVTALVFVKDYFEKSHDSSLVYGVVFWILAYIFGSIFIKKSEENNHE
jgi:ABC-type uncharacterized transport system permease subunit